VVSRYVIIAKHASVRIRKAGILRISEFENAHFRTAGSAADSRNDADALTC